MTTMFEQSLRALTAAELDAVSGAHAAIGGCVPRPGPKKPPMFPPTTGPTFPDMDMGGGNIPV